MGREGKGELPPTTDQLRGHFRLSVSDSTPLRLCARSVEDINAEDNYPWEVLLYVREHRI